MTAVAADTEVVDLPLGFRAVVVLRHDAASAQPPYQAPASPPPDPAQAVNDLLEQDEAATPTDRRRRGAARARANRNRQEID